MIKNKTNLIIKEIQHVLDKINEKQVTNLVNAILKAKKIVVVGAGRMGIASKAFAMRLSHMKFNSFTLGDSNVPNIGKGDLLLVSSGSGETQTIYDLVQIARLHNSRIALITTNADSRMAKLSNLIVEVHAPSKLRQIRSFKSRQPMTTLNEQVLWIFFDALTLLLMEKKGYDSDEMWKNHSILE